MRTNWRGWTWATSAAVSAPSKYWPPEDPSGRGRKAKSIDEKESFRWIEAIQRGAAAARRMPQTQLGVSTDREGDLYELHDAAQIGPANLRALIRAQHDRTLDCHQKLWAFMESQPVGDATDA